MNLDTFEKSPAELHNLLVSATKLKNHSHIIIGRVLTQLKENNNYINAVGEMSWNDYLKQPEIDISVSDANRMMDIYSELVLRLGYDEETIAEIPVKNLHYLLPLIRDKKTIDEADELVCDATLLSQKDFKEKVYELKVGDERAHKKTYSYVLMKRTNETGSLSKIYDVDSETIKKTFNLE